ncbi:DegQ family serine endoprotease [Thalassospira xiamenensis]|uniref:DegQ family serine endoprotease n=1 Tax=Thalassospira xiamenensis TaxID=220697 RepID=UPI0007A3D9A0|nr:DegQ family serine endoprotease [Thalassospira xiamenensis]KZB56075.1 serine protease [Thalassospira xiamenensis]
MRWLYEEKREFDVQARLIATVMTGIMIVSGAMFGQIGLASAQDRRLPESQTEIKMSLSPLVKQTAPAVVNIYTKKVVTTQQRSPFFNDPFFRQFFGDRFGGAFGAPRQRVERSLGSGVIVSSDGTIVTNHHVIEGASEIRVVLHDNREFDAELVGSDERTDLAVLRLRDVKDELPAITLGDSDAVEVGDLVLAIGNPFGVGQTVTSGIVSALARAGVTGQDYQSFIQTDAAINPGNSGGALVDIDGRLIGVNSAIFTKSGGSNGIGFAVPVNMVKVVMRGLISGDLRRPWLGAAGQSVTADLASSLDLDRPHGVLINEVRQGSPANRGGLLPGDVVIAVNGLPVDNPNELKFRIATLELDHDAELSVLRKGQEVMLRMPLEVAPELPAREETEVEGRNPFSGSKIANVNPALADEIGIDTLSNGVVVLAVKRDSLARRARIQPGDYIVEVNGVPIDTVARLKEVVKAGERAREWSIAVKRDGKVLTAEFTL